MKGGYQYTKKRKLIKLKKSKINRNIKTKKGGKRRVKQQKRKTKKYRKRMTKKQRGGKSLSYSNWNSTRNITELKAPPHVAGKVNVNYLPYEKTGGLELPIQQRDQLMRLQQGGGNFWMNLIPSPLKNIYWGVENRVNNVINEYNGKNKMPGPNPMDGGIMTQKMKNDISKPFNITKSIETNYRNS